MKVVLLLFFLVTILLTDLRGLMCKFFHLKVISIIILLYFFLIKILINWSRNISTIGS